MYALIVLSLLKQHFIHSISIWCAPTWWLGISLSNLIPLHLSNMDYLITFTSKSFIHWESTLEDKLHELVVDVKCFQVAGWTLIFLKHPLALAHRSWFLIPSINSFLLISVYFLEASRLDLVDHFYHRHFSLTDFFEFLIVFTAPLSIYLTLKGFFYYLHLSLSLSWIVVSPLKFTFLRILFFTISIQVPSLAFHFISLKIAS